MAGHVPSTDILNGNKCKTENPWLKQRI